ncbi:GIY-YIG nuclease family protein [Arthrobacter sp. zg-Y877]|uniref:GIY-YIG nuclease family protein n=1 Tax=Arthrobacter sp. zg-Y877 TaxID=3049074 RepID=UPI0025A49F6D|nr:hypothetical protein [Arthrobacter sp. zg-Y877]MDM7990725.1 hypothetical protein [Arthrobacter sp. zg-Y877]
MVDDFHFTDELSATRAASALLAAPLVPSSGVFTKVLPPRAHGIYAWWMNQGAVPGLSGLTHPVDPSLELLYIGIASRTSSSLYARLSTHLTKTSRRSTLRLSLASVLAARQGWTASFVSGRPALNPGFENDLTQFIHNSLSLSWIQHSAPRDVEEQMIQRLQPPLNLDGNSAHPAYTYVKTARAAFRATAYS